MASADSPTGANLFIVEAVQLTEEVLEEINAQTDESGLLALVGFGNDTDSNAAALSRRSGACKTFPGD